MKFAEYLITFIQIIIIILFSFLLLYSNNQVEDFRRRRRRRRRRRQRKVNAMNHAVVEASRLPAAYSDLYRKRYQEIGGTKEQAIMNERPFVNHFNLHWNGRAKGWRNDGSGHFRSGHFKNYFHRGPNEWGGKGTENLGDLANAAKPFYTNPKGGGMKTADKHNSVYVGYNLQLMHNVLHRNLNDTKKYFDKKKEQERKAKEEAERKRKAELELQNRRRNRHSDINNLVKDSHALIDPLFKRNIGQYKSTPGRMSQNYVNQIKNSAGANLHSSRWYPKYLGNGAVKASQLYKQRDKLLKDEKEKVRQKGLADSIKKANETRREYVEKRLEADRLTRESEKAKARELRNLANKKANFKRSTERAYKSVGRFMNAQHRNAHRNALKPATFTKNITTHYYNTNKKKGDEVVGITKDLKERSALGARDFAERVDLSWADKMIANNPL